MTDPLRDRLAAALGPTYELQRLLGKGGMGSVYLARETALDRLVAVKVLPPETTGDSETRERFRREARTAAKLTHPHIVPLYTFGEADGLLWFVMGYVAGETLASKLERTPRLDPEIVRRVLGEVAEALDYAHGHGIVHRDVKPENILIEDAGGKALLADFGVARAGTGASTLTTAGALVGTPHYMSPEQASGERDLDGRSDLYSLGVVGYRMLAGRTPFEGGDLRAVLAAHVMQPAPALPSDVSEDLRQVIMQAMAKAPLERWSSGAALRGRLDQGGFVGEEALDRYGNLPSALAFILLATLPVLLLWNALRERPWVDFAHDGANALLMLIPAIAVAILGIIAAERHRQKLSWRKALEMALWAPRWWAGWWPAAFRRPEDMWNRLPPFLRKTRTWGTCLIACYFPLIWVMIDVLHSPLSKSVVVNAFLAFAIVAFGVFVATIHFAQKKLFAAGLSKIDASRALANPTWNDRFWSRPEIARLLTAPPSKSSSSAPGSPAELAVEVKRVANALPSHHATLAQEAVQRSEEMARRIQQMDVELASLAAEVRQDDINGVERKLADLGPARADEAEARRAIRAMHEQQLGVLRRLQTQMEEGQTRREQLAGMLRTLYLQVSELKIATARLTEADTSGVRAIIDRMGREVEGLKEVGG